MKTTKTILIMLLAVIVISQVAACDGGAKEAVAKATLEALHAEEAAAKATLEALHAEEAAHAAATAEAELAEAEQAEPEEPSEPEPEEPEFSIAPGEPPPPQRTLEDSDSSIRAWENRAVTGDNFQKNLYERPFTAEEMIYQPDLDIITVDFADGGDFFYFTIRLFGMNPDESGLNGTYGIEFDRTLTGRGDLIVLVENPTEEWSVENMAVFADGNEDVGGPTPIYSDPGGAGDGHDRQLDMGADFVAYARIDPEDEAAVQIAVSRAMLGDPEEFLWGAWADNGLRNVSMFDYNDVFTFAEAGSPINTDAEYPLKELFNLDSTCRLPYGFEQGGSFYAGMCINTPPVVDKPVSKCRGVIICLQWEPHSWPSRCLEWGCD
jgi:hypothetical protein